MRLKFSDITIRQLPHTDKQVRYYDIATPGFGLTVGKRTKTFWAMYGAKRSVETIGQYPEISLADARKQAKVLLSTQPDKNARVAVSDAVATYLADIRTTVRPATYSEYARFLSSAPKTNLKDLAADQVSTEAHAVAAWKAFANWCIRKGLLDKNPFQYIPVTYGKRSRILNDDEIRILWAYDHPPYSDILKLCLLTGQRVGEVTGFCPAWIAGDTITVPPDIAKNGREHTIPFNLLTGQYLKRYQGKTFNGFSKAKARLDTLHPMPHWTVHDLRRTFSTTHARIGTPIHVTERLLNHVTGSISGVAAVYNQYSYLKEMRQAVLQYETFIASLVGARA